MEIFKAMIKSFAPPEAYERAAFEWKWKAVAYFLGQHQRLWNRLIF